MNSTALSKRLKKNQLQNLRQDLLIQFCDATEEETKTYNSIHQMASISGFFFEAETILNNAKKELANTMIPLCSSDDTVLSFDSLAINKINADIQQYDPQQLKEQHKPQELQQQLPWKSYKEQKNTNDDAEVRTKSKILTGNQSNSKQKRYNQNDKVRLEIWLNISPSSDNKPPKNKLKLHLQEMIEKSLEVEKELAILPWFNKDEEVPLDNCKVPDNQFTFLKYFQRFQPKIEGFTYGEIIIKIKRRWEDILFDLTPWLSEKKHGLYFQHLQCQKRTNLCWLLWSFRRIEIPQYYYKKSKHFLTQKYIYVIKI
jgi:hypothetical protein